jgi:alpha/beta superfamily hydrolase
MLLAQEQNAFLMGVAGQIELAYTPLNAAKVMIICHPHPQFGGTMDNKVVTTIARAARASGFATVRFNFRGVGKSQGVYDEGRGEQSDLVTVLNWVLQQEPQAEIVLAGFSFGAWIVTEVACQQVPTSAMLRGLYLVAPPVQYPAFAALHPHCSVAVIQGDRDDVVNMIDVKKWVDSRRKQPDWRLIQGADHFFHGRLAELKQALLDINARLFAGATR